MDLYSPCIIFFMVKVILVESVKDPTFVSDWEYIEAETVHENYTVTVDHGINSLPAKVDVQIKAIDGPNEGFIFPGTSSPQSDDDVSAPRGGLIYIYNENEVKIFTALNYNGNPNGKIIHTGKASNRIGPNTQTSISGEFRTRVWSSCDFPKPDFMSEWVDIEANNGTNSFTEIHHNLGVHPAYITVQVKIMEGTYTGYFIDGTGTCMVNVVSDLLHYAGVLYGYDENTVRIWLPTSPTELGLLSGMVDGWGLPGSEQSNSVANKGQVRVTAWLNFGIPVMQSLTTHGNGVNEYEFSIGRNDITKGVFVKAEVQAMDGNNTNYRFPGTGASMEFPALYGSYGGIIYAYNNYSVRLWKPVDTNEKGYIVYVGDMWGGGINSQQSKVANVIITFWEFTTEDGPCFSDVCKLSKSGYYCSSDLKRQSKFELYAKDKSPTNITYLGQYDISSLMRCSNMCLVDTNCAILASGNGKCILYRKSAFNSTLTEDIGIQLWLETE